MNKILSILSFALLALSLGSCSLAPENSNSEQAPEANNPTQPNGGANPAFASKNSEVSVLVEPTSPGRGTDVSGLIASTNPNQRKQSIVKGRPDPFGPIVLPPVKSTEPARQSLQKNPDNSSQTAAAKLKTPPDPVLAKGVAIKGVITVSGNTKVILKAPNEKFSRYVSPGSYLSNGQVLVKRVDTDRNPPVVVLEQFGIEVVKRVGEGGENLSPIPKPEEPTAFLSKFKVS